MISVVPPMLRQSICTGRPYRAACHLEKPRANSSRIEAMCGETTTRTGSPSRHSPASRAGRRRNGSAHTSAAARRMEAFLSMAGSPVAGWRAS